MVGIPRYLVDKLANVGIKNINELRTHGYLKVYKWIKDSYPSVGKRVLFDLYSISSALPINSISKDCQKSIIAELKQMLPTYIPLDTELIKKNLFKAEEQAKIAGNYEEVPIGAIITYKKNTIIGVGYNQTLSKCDIISHAEIIAIQEAQKYLGSYRLTDCDLYVTIEPCLMCAGAIIQSRIRRVIFGATEPKTGAIISQYSAFTNKRVNHYTETIGPFDNEYYAQLLSKFFINKRREIKT